MTTPTPAPTAQRSGRVPLGSAAVGAVLGLAGLMFVVSASTATASRHPQDLVELVHAKVEKVEAQAAQVDTLRAQVEALTAAAARSSGLTPASTAMQVASGSVAVTGPGLVVTLDDAPAGSAPAGVSADVLVVHQQDIQAVINALRAGGAEAVALQGQRLISTSAVQCVGNVLRVDGRVHSPPYTISAIGDVAAMREALDASPAVRTYQRDAAEVGLGWSLHTVDALVLPAYSGATDLVHASVPPGTDVLGTSVTAS
ncbi:MAG: DUF881 domain-containing protein [Micrococcales bacterium]|nr:DUF881 domain-containing protein [Micrococcales bacterium]